MKVAIVGDSFTDIYCAGEVVRISPEAPVPVLDVTEQSQKPGGALNVAFNLFSLGIMADVYTISDWQLPFNIISPIQATPLTKTRFVSQNHQLLRVDQPKGYNKQDLKRMKYPRMKDYDIIVCSDYDKGIVKGGEYTFVDTKKTDLSVFKAQVLKVNALEKSLASGIEHFPEAYITKGSGGIDYYKYGKRQLNERSKAKEVIDVSRAGDTVMAVLVYCKVHGITDPKEIMALANKAASAVISRFGTATVTLEDLQ